MILQENLMTVSIVLCCFLMETVGFFTDFLKICGNSQIRSQNVGASRSIKIQNFKKRYRLLSTSENSQTPIIWSPRICHP